MRLELESRSQTSLAELVIVVSSATYASRLERRVVGVVFRRDSCGDSWMLSFCPWCGADVAPRVARNDPQPDAPGAT